MSSTDVPNSSRAEPKLSARMENTSKISPRPHIDETARSQLSSRSDQLNTGRSSARSTKSATGSVTNRSDLETFRTSMDTTRVHTALAALAAERQALTAKLATIDLALETEKTKTLKLRKK